MENGSQITKTIEQNFADWESTAFGFGYGTGEEPVLRALKGFFDCIGIEAGGSTERGYNYERLEESLGAAVAWLLINRLCQIDVIEYGTSPRFAWLTGEGEALKAFIDQHTVAELEEICQHSEDPGPCYPDACNCGPKGYEKGRVCPNPFWKGHH